MTKTHSEGSQCFRCARQSEPFTMHCRLLHFKYIVYIDKRCFTLTETRQRLDKVGDLKKAFAKHVPWDATETTGVIISPVSGS